MDEKNKKITDEEREAEFYAADEAAFTAEDLALEIEPLLKAYFLGRFKREGDGINCLFLNGEKFRVTVEKVS